jgi:hypothetical protein
MEIVLLIALAGAAQDATAAQPATAAVVATSPDFSGRWLLDAGKSEDARQKLRQAMQGHHAGPGERGGPGGHGAPGGGASGRQGGHRGGGAPGGQGRPAGQGRSEAGRPESVFDALETPAEMAITATPGEIAILEKDGRLRTLHPDGKKYRAEGGSNEVTTRWQSGQLVVETKPEKGPKVTETFRLGEGEPRELTVNLRLETMFAGTVEVRRVYAAPAP